MAGLLVLKIFSSVKSRAIVSLVSATPRASPIKETGSDTNFNSSWTRSKLDSNTKSSLYLHSWYWLVVLCTEIVVQPGGKLSVKWRVIIEIQTKALDYIRVATVKGIQIIGPFLDFLRLFSVLPGLFLYHNRKGFLRSLS